MFAYTPQHIKTFVDSNSTKSYKPQAPRPPFHRCAISFAKRPTPSNKPSGFCLKPSIRRRTPSCTRSFATHLPQPSGFPPAVSSYDGPTSGMSTLRRILAISYDSQPAISTTSAASLHPATVRTSRAGPNILNTETPPSTLSDYRITAMIIMTTQPKSIPGRTTTPSLTNPLLLPLPLRRALASFLIARLIPTKKTNNAAIFSGRRG